MSEMPPGALIPHDEKLVRQHFEEALSIRRQGQTSEIGLRWKELAVRHIAALAPGLLDTFASDLGLRVSSDVYARMSPWAKRRLMVESFVRGLPVQPEAASELVELLMGLNAGEVTPLAMKSGARRGIKPSALATAQLQLLQWVRWQHGLGRPLQDVLAQVAEAVGLTINAIRGWEAELEKAFGGHIVALELSLAEDVGRLERDKAKPRVWDSDHGQRVFSVQVTLQRDLKELAAKRQAAAAKRKVPKP